MNILWLFLAILLQINAYTAARSYLSHTQCGTKQIIDDTHFASGIYTFKYNINYKLTYTNIPDVIIGINTLKHCPISRNLYVEPFADLQKILTKFVLYARQFIGYSNDSFMTMIVNYFVVDTIINTNIEIAFYDLEYFLVQNPSVQIFFNKPWVNQVETYFSCFIRGIYCQKSPILNFQISTSWFKSGDKQLTYTYNTNALVSGVSNCGSGFLLRGVSIAIRYGFSFTFSYSALQATSLPSDVISIDIKNQATVFFIGLVQFQSPNHCVNLALNKSTLSIDTSSYFNKVVYQYFSIHQPYISLISYYPQEDKVIFYFQQLNGFYIKSILSSRLAKQKSESNYFVTRQTNPFINSPHQITFTFKKDSVGEYDMYFYLKMLTSKYIIMSPELKILDVFIMNTDQPLTQNNFIISGNYINMDSVDDSASDTKITFSYTYQAIGKQFKISHTSSTKIQIAIQITLTIPNIISVQNSINSDLVEVFVYDKDPNIVRTTSTQYDPNTVETLNPVLWFTDFPNIVISSFVIFYKFNVISIKHMEITHQQKKLKMKFINIPNVVNIQDFSTSLQGTKITNIQTDNNNVIVHVDYSSSIINNPSFSMIFQTSSLSYYHKINNFNLIRIIKINVDIFAHKIYIILHNIQEVSVLPIISFKQHSHIVYNNTQFEGNNVKLSLDYNAHVQGQNISIFYDSDPNSIYSETINHQLLDQNQLFIFCISPFEKMTKSYEDMSLFLVILYWLIFVVSLLFCQKIFAVQLLFVLQFSYMSLIPIGIICPPFSAFKYFKYSFGWNGLHFNFDKTLINMNYSSLGISSHFLSNINFMFIPLLLCPIIYGIMMIIGNYSNGYRAKPRLLTYGKTFLLDVPFALLLAITPNICVSFVVMLQNIKTMNIVSLVIGIISVLFILTFVIIFLVLKNSFRQFKNQFCDRLQICTISIDTSTSIRKKYPLILLFEIMLVSAILGVQSFMNFSLYLCLGIFIVITIIIILITPYKHSIDNIRLITHRSFLIIISCLQIGFIHIKDDNAKSSSFSYDYPWITLIMLLLLAAALNFPYIAYNSIKWLKGRDMMDVNLYNKIKKINKKVSYPNNPVKQGCFYPAFEYSMFHNKDQKYQIKKLLNLKQLNKKKEQPMEWSTKILPENSQS